MAGMQAPEEIKLVRAERRLEVRFLGGQAYSLPAELLRIESPSAEVQGHGAEFVVRYLGVAPREAAAANPAVRPASPPPTRGVRRRQSRLSASSFAAFSPGSLPSFSHGGGSSCWTCILMPKMYSTMA